MIDAIYLWLYRTLAAVAFAAVVCLLLTVFMLIYFIIQPVFIAGIAEPGRPVGWLLALIFVLVVTGGVAGWSAFWIEGNALPEPEGTITERAEK